MEVSKGVENAGLLSKFAKDCDEFNGSFWGEDSSLKKSNLLDVDIFMTGEVLILGFCKYKLYIMLVIITNN